MAVFGCMKCGHVQTVEEIHIGKSTRCPKCREPGHVQANMANGELLVTDLYDGEDPASLPATRRGSGGSIQTVLSPGIIVNEESSLTREWITVGDPGLLAHFVGLTGVSTSYKRPEDYSAGGYQYVAKYSLRAVEDLRAFEVRFLTFDVWGCHVTTLSMTEVIDLFAGSNRDFEGGWDVYSHNRVSEHYASIAFIAQVRTALGKVLEGNRDLVIEEARKFSSKFTEIDLEPKKDPR